MLRRHTSTVLTVLCGAAVVGSVVQATSASASASTTPAFVATSSTVLGDVSGDGLRDRVVLGRLGTAGACAVKVTPGVTGGGFATTASTVTLPVRRIAGSAVTCPDRAVVLPGPTPAAARLAVTFSAGAGGASPSVQVFRLVGGTAVYSVGFAGQDQPSTIATRDFDGDGYGDVWESTDQGEGFSAYLVRATTTTTLYRSPTTASAVATFVDLDHSAGIDIVLTTDAYPYYNASAVAVDGRTGVARVLAACNDGTVTNYQVTAVDTDHDGYLDLRVTSVADPYSGLTAVTKTFLNRSQLGKFAFVATR